MFERGYFSHEMVADMNCEVMVRIDKGFKFFTDWINTILIKGVYTL